VIVVVALAFGGYYGYQHIREDAKAEAVKEQENVARLAKERDDQKAKAEKADADRAEEKRREKERIGAEEAAAKQRVIEAARQKKVDEQRQRDEQWIRDQQKIAEDKRAEDERLANAKRALVDEAVALRKSLETLKKELKSTAEQIEYRQRFLANPS